MALGVAVAAGLTVAAGIAMLYDDEYDWSGDCDRAAARRAVWSVIAVTVALGFAGLAFLLPLG